MNPENQWPQQPVTPQPQPEPQPVQPTVQPQQPAPAFRPFGTVVQPLNPIEQPSYQPQPVAPPEFQAQPAQPIAQPQQPTQTFQPNPMQPMQSQYQAPVAPKVSKGLSIAGLILAFMLPPVGLIISIICLLKAKKSGVKSGLGLAGTIIGSLGTIFGIIILCVMIPAALMLTEKCSELGSGSHTVDGVTYECDDVFTNINTGLESFNPGTTEEYTALGYMDYTVPESWTYNEEKSAEAQYNLYYFDYEDNVSEFFAKASSVYNPDTLTYGTDHDKLIASIEEIYGDSYTEETTVINDRLWYHITSYSYSLSQETGSDEYHDEIYYFISDSGSNVYTFYFTVSDDLSSVETSTINDSIDYILDSAVLQKADE